MRHVSCYCPLYRAIFTKFPCTGCLVAIAICYCPLYRAIFTIHQGSSSCITTKVIALYIGLFSRVHPRNDADGDLVIALYIGLFSHSMQNTKQLEQNAILLLPSISGYFHPYDPDLIEHLDKVIALYIGLF